MLSILYMLLVYCQFIVFFIFFCSFLSSMSRFFRESDDISAAEQRRLPVSQGGRGHPLLRRSFSEYMHAFDFAFHIFVRGRVNRAAELRYLQNYRNSVRTARQANRLRSVVYKE